MEVIILKRKRAAGAWEPTLAAFATNDHIDLTELRERCDKLGFTLEQVRFPQYVLNGESLSARVRDTVCANLDVAPGAWPDEDVPADVYLFGSAQSCAEAGDHLKRCDSDGYCNLCGEQ